MAIKQYLKVFGLIKNKIAIIKIWFFSRLKITLCFSILCLITLHCSWDDLLGKIWSVSASTGPGQSVPPPGWLSGSAPSPCA